MQEKKELESIVEGMVDSGGLFYVGQPGKSLWSLQINDFVMKLYMRLTVTLNIFYLWIIDLRKFSE